MFPLQVYPYLIVLDLCRTVHYGSAIMLHRNSVDSCVTFLQSHSAQFCIDPKQLRRFPHNIRAIMAKIKLPKKPHSMVLLLIKATNSYRDLSSQADPAREN